MHSLLKMTTMDCKALSKKPIGLLLTLMIYLISFSSTTSYAQEFIWSTVFSGISEDLGTDIVTDSNGNIYVVGLFENLVDFDPGDGVYYLNELHTDKGNIYCVKLSPSGELIWAHQVGGTYSYTNSFPNLDQPRLAIDGSDNIYITGLYDYRVDFDTSTSNTYFIPNPDMQSTTFRFVCKLDSNGNFEWAKQICGDNFSYSEVENIETDSSGNVYVSGNFDNVVDFDPGPNTFNLSTNNTLTDVFCLKLDTNGNFLWAKQMGNPTENDVVNDMSIDNQHLYITGYYRGQADFDPSANVSNLNSVNGSEDAFMAKYELSTGDLVWAKSIGDDNGSDTGRAIVADNEGNVYATGEYRGAVDFDFSPSETFIMNSIGASSVYLLKVDTNGDFLWVKNFGAVNGSNGSSERPNDLAVNSMNSVCLSGYFLHQMDCDPDPNNEFNLIFSGGRDVFLLQLDSNGNFTWARNFGGPSDEFTYKIEIDMDNNIIMAGTFNGLLDFNPGGDGGEVDNPTSFDAFFLKLNDTSLGIEELSHFGSTVISPNPASEFFKISSQSEISKVSVYDINGKLLFDKTIDDPSETIPVDILQKGIYFIDIQSNSRHIIKKLIKH